MLVDDSQATVTPSLPLHRSEGQMTIEPRTFEALRATLPASALLEIYAVFLSDTRKRLALVGKSEARGALPDVVHAIRGSAGMIGATAIALLAEQLENEPDAPLRLLTACEQLQAALRAEGLPL